MPTDPVTPPEFSTPEFTTELSATLECSPARDLVTIKLRLPNPWGHTEMRLTRFGQFNLTGGPPHPPQLNLSVSSRPAQLGRWAAPSLLARHRSDHTPPFYNQTLQWPLQLPPHPHRRAQLVAAAAALLEYFGPPDHATWQAAVQAHDPRPASWQAPPSAAHLLAHPWVQTATQGQAHPDWAQHYELRDYSRHAGGNIQCVPVMLYGEEQWRDVQIIPAPGPAQNSAAGLIPLALHLTEAYERAPEIDEAAWLTPLTGPYKPFLNRRVTVSAQTLRVTRS